MSAYLLFSAGIHAAVLALFLFVVPSSPPAKKYYVIDLMGGQSGQGTGLMEPAPAPAGGRSAAPEKGGQDLPEAGKDDPSKVAVKKEPKAPPKKAEKKPAKKEPAGPAKAPRNKGAAGGRGESADGKGDIHGAKTGPVGGVGTSLEIGGFGPGGGAQAGPRFPYQWYVQTIYKRLWESWDRADVGDKECGVAFTILRNGAVDGVSVEDSSGDAFFDLTARRAVENAAPFPPLPEGFQDPKLKVSVRFRLQ